MKMMNIKSIARAGIVSFAALCALLVAPLMALAFAAEVRVDTGTESVNAIEGLIRVPIDVSVESIQIGNSSVLLWVTVPIYDAASRTISFSGITPGGFRGNNPVFALTGDFTAADLEDFIFSGTRGLKSDGSGETVPLGFSLGEKEIAPDDAPPEPFTPAVTSSHEIFDGNTFVSFAAQDKGSGIERYEYSSTWLLPPSDDSWTAVESPLLLKRADKFKNIYIRAIDGSGNFRAVSTAGPYHYAFLFSIGIIILSCLALFARRSLLSRSL